VKVNGKLCYLWRDHEGEVLEAVVTAKRDKAAALKLLKRIMKTFGRPRSVVTDGLCSYPAAMKEIGNADRHEVGRPLNNRAENSHQPFRAAGEAVKESVTIAAATIGRFQGRCSPAPYSRRKTVTAYRPGCPPCHDRVACAVGISTQ